MSDFWPPCPASIVMRLWGGFQTIGYFSKFYDLLAFPVKPAAERSLIHAFPVVY